MDTLDLWAQKQRKWDVRYFKLAKVIASWSKDPRAKVGAVIVNSDRGRIISVGFNGFPSNVQDSVERLADADKNHITIHAEQNALLFAGRDALGCDLYVVGKPICNTCAIMAIQSGIKRVIAKIPRRNTESQWDQLGIIAMGILLEAKVNFCPTDDFDLSPKRDNPLQGLMEAAE